MTNAARLDLHMHSTVSDGSDSPEQLLMKVKNAGIRYFALSDHDDFAGCSMIKDILTEGDPVFIDGVEFSCRDDQGKYHILGYGYDPESQDIINVVNTGHGYRMNKARERVNFVVEEFGFKLPQEEIDKFMSLPNPGKPHLGNLLVKYGYAPNKEVAIKDIIDKAPFHDDYLRPEFAIQGILASGGIPVLAHGIYGSGDQLIIGEEMDERMERLVGFGLKGVEAFYSGFTFKMRDMMLSYADQYDLYVTAGSDYHGTNKMIELGDNGLAEYGEWPARLSRFIDMVVKK